MTSICFESLSLKEANQLLDTVYSCSAQPPINQRRFYTFALAASVEHATGVLIAGPPAVYYTTSGYNKMLQVHRLAVSAGTDLFLVMMEEAWQISKRKGYFSLFSLLIPEIVHTTFLHHQWHHWEDGVHKNGIGRFGTRQYR